MQKMAGVEQSPAHGVMAKEKGEIWLLLVACCLLFAKNKGRGV